MVKRDIGQLGVQVADEDGVRRYFFSVQAMEKFQSLYRVKVSKAPSMTQPLLVAEVFGDSPGGLIEFALERTVNGEAADLRSTIAELANVDVKDVRQAAKRVTLDTVYLLSD